MEKKSDHAMQTGPFSSLTSVDEALALMHGLAHDYDGFNTVESLKSLIDELMEIERIARKLLHEGRLFPDHTDSNTDGKAVD